MSVSIVFLESNSIKHDFGQLEFGSSLSKILKPLEKPIRPNSNLLYLNSLLYLLRELKNCSINI
jgi:hypothetical protein